MMLKTKDKRLKQYYKPVSIKDKAKIIADVIACTKDKSDIMDLIHSAIEGKANDLLDIENEQNKLRKI